MDDHHFSYIKNLEEKKKPLRGREQAAFLFAGYI
jgi:hypothetical protein